MISFYCLLFSTRPNLFKHVQTYPILPNLVFDLFKLIQFDVLPSIEVLPSQVSTRVVNNSCRLSFALGAATAEYIN